MVDNFPDFLSGRSEQLVALQNLSMSCRPLFMSASRIKNLGESYESDASWRRDVQVKDYRCKSRPTHACLQHAELLHPIQLPRRKLSTAERRAWALGLGSALFVLLADFFQVSLEELRSAQRGSSHVARIRQFGMYIAHTMFGLSMSEVAYAFSRERTTVKHACHLMEDMRENASFDRSVSSFEYLIRTIYPDAGASSDE